VSIGDYVNTIVDGITYDVTRTLLVPAIVTVSGTIIMRTIFQKLKPWKEMASFVLWTFIALVTVFYFIGSRPSEPRLVGSVTAAVTGGTNNGKDTMAIITMNIINAGTMQSIVKGWQVSAIINGNKYDGSLAQMPKDVRLLMPDLGIDSPSELIYHSDDDILIKTISAIQPGSMVPGTIFVIFKGVDPNVMKAGADIIVSYEDVFSKGYTTTVRITARSSVLGVTAGLHTDMVCRIPPGGVPK
jgi:hypothetical protein